MIIPETAATNKTFFLIKELTNVPAKLIPKTVIAAKERKFSRFFLESIACLASSLISAFIASPTNKKSGETNLPIIFYLFMIFIRSYLIFPINPIIFSITGKAVSTYLSWNESPASTSGA